MKEIDSKQIEILQDEAWHTVFPTVTGSSFFQVIAFTSNSNSFCEADRLCICNQCTTS